MNLGLDMVLAVFGGGVFGAAIGALPAFIFTGIMVLVGVAATAAGGGPAILDSVAFGPFFGPNVSFAGGVAAAAYAARVGLIPSGSDITAPLIKTKSFSVMMVGGLFGLIGHFITQALNFVKCPSDNVAVGVVLSGCIARLAFGKTGLFGKSDQVKGLVTGDGFAANLLVCASLGALSAWASAATGSAVIGFGVSATSLVFTQTGFGVPATHHVTLPAAIAGAAFGSVWAGLLFGAVGFILGDLGGNLFNKGVDTHVDPPAFAIAVLTTVVTLLQG